MLVDVRHVPFDAGDFGLERLDTLRQLILRQGAKVLLDEQGERVLRAAGEEVVLVHLLSVDPDRPQVNKLPAVAWEWA